jgi:uncharacterized protein (TIGR00255 family)
MTGFARTEGQIDGLSWAWELRSVNGKSFDLRLRLPPGWEAIEATCKTAIGDVLKRGSISGTLSVTEQARPPVLKLNEAVLAQVVALIRSLDGVIDTAPPRVDGLLGIRGVIEVAEAEITEEQRSVLQFSGSTSNTAARHAGSRTALAKQAAQPIAEPARPVVHPPANDPMR